MNNGSIVSAEGSRPGRKRRSRLDRPCDLCRRYKQQCVIPVQNEPCETCRARRKDCTFEAPPTGRSRKSTTESAAEHDHVTSLPLPNAFVATDAGMVPVPNLPGPSPLLADPVSLPVISSEQGIRLSRDQPEARDQFLIAPSNSSHPSNPALNDPPLDKEDDLEESHFIGSGTLWGLAVNESSELSSATLSYRQVSSDPRCPVYFVKQPTLLYGRLPNTGETAYQAVLRECAGSIEDVTNESLQKIRRILLPAFPIIDGSRLERSCLGIADAGPVPFGLLAGVVAHCTSYIPQIKPLHKSLWTHVLLGLDNEFRLPRLRTIQLAVLVISSRPSDNVGQSGIGLGRTISAAHLLGLHMDPTRWSLPVWERRIRQRLWWSLVIHDKWRAIIFGRPSGINHDNHDVPMLRLGDISSNADAMETISLETFIANCRVTESIERLLQAFYTVKAARESLGTVERITRLESELQSLRNLEASLSDSLRWRGGRSGILSTLPTGVRSWQLSLLGIRVIINRLMLDCSTDLSSYQAAQLHRDCTAITSEISAFLDTLTASDRGLFWMPYSSHHISNAVSLLLRVAIRAKAFDINTATIAEEHTTHIVNTLLGIHRLADWDIATAALRRIAALLLSGSHELPNLRSLHQLVSEGLGLTTGAVNMSTDLFSSLGAFGTDPMGWLGNDLSWLDPDVLDTMGFSDLIHTENLS